MSIVHDIISFSYFLQYFQQFVSTFTLTLHKFFSTAIVGMVETVAVCGQMPDACWSEAKIPLYRE